MRKIITSVSALALLFASCSKNNKKSNGNNIDPNTVLITKLVGTRTYNEDKITSFTREFEYSGTKLVKQTFLGDDGGYAKYTYASDNITKIENYNTSNVLIETTTISYDAEGKVTSVIHLDKESPDCTDCSTKQTVTYNTNGTITAKSYRGTAAAQTALYLTEEISYPTAMTKKVVSKEISSGGETFATYTTTYTFDAKNNPFKNITGYSKLEILGDDFHKNNVVSQVRSDDENNFTYDYDYNYSYNTADFPTVSVFTTAFTYGSTNYTHTTGQTH